MHVGLRGGAWVTGGSCSLTGGEVNYEGAVGELAYVRRAVRRISAWAAGRGGLEGGGGLLGGARRVESVGGGGIDGLEEVERRSPWRASRGEGGGEAEVAEDLGDDVGVGEVGDDAGWSSTAVADSEVDLVHSAEEVCPGETDGAVGIGGRPGSASGRRWA